MSAEQRVLDDADHLATTVAEALIERLAAIQAADRVPTVGLTGGSIARRVHRAVAASVNSLDVDWGQVEFWFGDERFVEAHSDDRNAKQSWQDFLQPLGVPPERVHEVPAADAGTELEDAAQAYADQMRSQGSGAFDVLFLGLGPDGHIASLFPGSPQLDVTDRIAVAVPESPKPPPQRVSLTFEALNHSRAVWFIVAGDDKAEAVRRSLAGRDPHTAPASNVVGSEETVWWLDRAAAG